MSGDVPASRGLHTMTYLPAVNKLVVFGGAPKSGPMVSAENTSGTADMILLACVCTLERERVSRGIKVMHLSSRLDDCVRDATL